VNLHGKLGDVSTWVFTKTELDKLLSDPGYRQFVAGCVMSNTILFIGMTADDPAIASHLDYLKKIGLELNTHFWLTDRIDGETTRRAEEMGIRPILYKNPDGKHAGVQEFFEDIAAFVPKDDVERVPVLLPAAAITAGTNLNNLAAKSSEELRQALNARASEILNSGGSAAYLEFEKFVQDYDPWIYRAWYHSEVPPENILLGYKLLEVIGKDWQRSVRPRLPGAGARRHGGRYQDPPGAGPPDPRDAPELPTRRSLHANPIRQHAQGDGEAAGRVGDPGLRGDGVRERARPDCSR
jgi:eukaryotic-like serine/threonine-protein kinase